MKPGGRILAPYKPGRDPRPPRVSHIAARCCSHRAADHLGFSQKTNLNGSRCTVPGRRCAGWIPQVNVTRPKKTRRERAAISEARRSDGGWKKKEVAEEIYARLECDGCGATGRALYRDLARGRHRSCSCEAVEPMRIFGR